MSSNQEKSSLNDYFSTDKDRDTKSLVPIANEMIVRTVGQRRTMRQNLYNRMPYRRAQIYALNTIKILPIQRTNNLNINFFFNGM